MVMVVMVTIAYYYRALASILSPYAIHTGSIGVIAMAPPSAWPTTCYSLSAIWILNVWPVVVPMWLDVLCK
jgi:hypothetical protein